MDTLQILDWNHSFTQQALIPESDFVKAAGERGLSIDRARLESLHRQRLLVPFFAIRYSARAVLARARADGIPLTEEEMRQVLRSIGRDRGVLLEERRAGDLADPAAVPYRPWKVSGKYRGQAYARRRYLYSPYQFQGLKDILAQCPDGNPLQLEERWRQSATWKIARRYARIAGDHHRRTAILLSLLETAYRPEAYPQLRGLGLDLAAWSAYRRSFDPKTALLLMDLTPADLPTIARRLLSSAHSFDPLADWSDLVALTHYSRWTKLKGLARLALDYRIAAEVLLLAYEDLVRKRSAPELPKSHSGWWSPLDYRLNRRREDLDKTLTKFGLSPHPAVLLVVEGKIEAELIRRFLDARLRPGWQTQIHLLDAQGVHKDPSAAGALVAPRSAGDEQDLVLLARPPTHIVIVADPEGPFANQQGRDHVRDRWVDRLFQALAPHDQTPGIRLELQGLVEIETWDASGNSFEYAHFTDREIADSIRSVSRSPSTPPLDELTAAVGQARAKRRNVKSIWSQWSPPRPNKMAVARSLEPTLFKMVNASIDSTEDPPSVPLARVIVHVLRLATRPGHHQYVMRRTLSELPVS